MKLFGILSAANIPSIFWFLKCVPSCCSGYDFGYLLKILSNRKMPEEEQEFFEFLKMFFPNIYDVKYLMKSCKNLKGGLQEVADQLEVTRKINVKKVH